MKALLFVVPVLAGCTHHYDIANSYEVAGEEVTLQGQYGQEVTAIGVQTAGGVVFYDRANGGMVPDGEIVRIKDVRHGRGAIEGLGIGGGIGVGIGVLVGLASGDDECDSETSDHGGCWFSFSAGDKAMIGGILLGGLGGFLGLIVGAMKGSTIIYEQPSSGISVRVGGTSDSPSALTVNF